jgi:hypothetical protein
MRSSGVCLISPMTFNSFQPSEQTEMFCARRTLLPEETAERAFEFGIVRNSVSAVAWSHFHPSTRSTQKAPPVRFFIQTTNTTAQPSVS